MVRLFIVLAFLLATRYCDAAEQKSSNPPAALQWIEFPDSRFKLNGLPWFSENAPELWRLPKTARTRVPAGVWNRAVAPDGGRIRFVANTSRLAIRVQLVGNSGKPCYFDAFTNGISAGSGKVSGTNKVDLGLFESRESSTKEITIYLPNNHEVRVIAIGVDQDTVFKEPKPFSLPHPIVCYGSSVLQGTGATHPSMTYPAGIARRLNSDFVNLGFGGAGKAEPEVVELVSKVKASCYLFDLGKSYGPQGIEPYARMLKMIRTAHPTVPIFCITPIYSTKEASDPDYKKKSDELRAWMRQAVVNLQRSGDHYIFPVEGLDLIGPAEAALFADPLHPNDKGNEHISKRLAPIMREILLPL
jgi:hypothetical protein